MAFALTKAAFYGTEIESVSSKRGAQVCDLTITAANTDVDLDIGDDTGTFWTAVGTAAGSMGAAVLALLVQIDDISEELIAVGGESFLSRLKSAAGAGASEYAIAIQASTHRPNITWNSGTAPTSYKVQLSWLLENGKFPVVGEFAT